MGDLFLNIGISNPVTKHSAGSSYHQQLARQLADFLLDRDRLMKAGGVMTLPDVYCLFNRARGFELISPGLLVADYCLRVTDFLVYVLDDLRESINLFHTLSLPMHVRKFGSGVIVIELDSHDDTQMCEKMVSLTDEHGGLNAIQLSDMLKIPLPLTREYIQVGYLLRFFQP